MAAESEDLFAQHRQNINTPGGTIWEGDAKDAAFDRVTADLAVVHNQGDVLREAANGAQSGVTDISAAQRDAVAAINAAEGDGFRVREDLSVVDSRPTDISTLAARQTAAAEHAEDIRWTAERLVQTDTLVGERLQAKAADLEGIRFDGEGDGRDGTIQAVDNETPDENESDRDGEPDAGEDPEAGDADTPAEDGPKSPHPDYPNRNKDGTYGDGNSRDGKEAEKKALDEREERTGVPIIRDQVRATHPDVTNPNTGKPQGRYYDGLEPTGNPDEYIGIEAKTDEGVDLTTDQKRFDAEVSPERPATATVNGREVKIVDTEVIYPSAPAEQPPAPSTPDTGAQAGSPGTAVPPSLANPSPSDSGAQVEGQVPASTPELPDWGTQLTPQEMIASDDPAMRVLGQMILEQMREQGIVDPSSTA